MLPAGECLRAPATAGVRQKSVGAGDEAGVQKGVVSSKTKGECEFMMYSFDVKFEGKNACRMGDPLYHNKKNIMG
jgi:hypothetical protein